MSQRGPVKTPSSEGARQPMSEMPVCLMVTSWQRKAGEIQKCSREGHRSDQVARKALVSNRPLTEPAESDGESPVERSGKELPRWRDQHL